jgi:hypothetical protein
MRPRGQNPAGQAARRSGRPDRARLVRQAVRLHAAVRGAGAGPGPADDRCRGRPAGQRVLAPRACNLFAQCRSRGGPSRPVGGKRGGDRRDLLPWAFSPRARPVGRPRLFDHRGRGRRTQDRVRHQGARRHDHRPFCRTPGRPQSAPEPITTVSIDTSPAFIRGVATACPGRASPLINSMSSPMPRPPSTRPGAFNSAAIPASKDCAGRCSRTASGYPPQPAPISMP